VKPDILRLGTFFSGIETPSIALKQSGVKHKLVFAIELEPTLRELIRVTWRPDQIHEDVNNVEFDKLPFVDMVVGGPPCQSFCRGGKNKGLKDPRGILIFKMVEYLEARKKAGEPLPSSLVLENSKTLLLGHVAVYKKIKRRLKKLGYSVKSRILDTKRNGICHSRTNLHRCRQEGPWLHLQVPEGFDHDHPAEQNPLPQVEEGREQFHQ
jgi:DNA (cytosine-5)-methyltransferase 1